MMNKTNFKEIASADIADFKQIVLSRAENGDYILAQRAVIPNTDGKRPTFYYNKGAMLIKAENVGDFVTFAEDIINYFPE